MKLISIARLNAKGQLAHHDISDLLISSFDAWERELKVAQDKHAAAVAEVKAFEALPWYRRMIAVIEPTSNWEQARVDHARGCLEWLKKICVVATYKLTMEFDARETSILLFEGPK